METLHHNPYLGPRAFTREHRLYGRDRELRDLTSLLVSERIVLLYSPSGAGKSSLVQAALIPALEARRFRVLPIVRVGLALPASMPPDANRYLAAAALSIGGDEAIERSLAELIVPPEQTDPDDTVLIFDQFEELLTVDPLHRAAKEQFCRTVGDLLRANRFLWALFIIREDYLAPLMEYAHFFPSRFRNTFRLDLLGPEAALAAIRRPALDAGVEFELATARSLVDDLRRARVQLVSDQVETMLGATVEPVQLQVVCYRLWQRLFPDGAPAGAAITSAALRMIGSVDEALADYYAERVAAAAAASGVRERVIRDWFDQQLITAGNIRNQVLRGEGVTAGLPNAALPPLINAYLIRAEQRRNFTWYELAHDRLIEPVRQNNAAWRERLAPFQRQAALWSATDRPASLLLQDADLAAAQAWVAAHPEQVEQIDEEFLKACRERQAEIDADRRRERLIRRLGVVSAVLAVVMLIAATAAFLAYQEADRLSRLARARELAAEAAVNLAVDPQLSLLLARQAVLVHRERNEPVDLAAESILYRALAVSRARATVDLGASVTALAVSADDRWWAAATISEAGAVEVVLVERADGRMQRLAGASDLVAALAFSPDSSKLVAVTWDGMVLGWATANPGQATRWLHPAVAGGNTPVQQDATLGVRLLDVVFGPDGNSVYTAGYDGWLRRWDAVSGRQVVIGGEEGVPLVSLTIDPAGVRIAAATQTGELFVWRLRLTPTMSAARGAMLSCRRRRIRR
ncbi:NACHT and WD repeat domain-containing protein, partial [Chloroflexus islandicus]|uniref:NACHT and WD repeat domain-containing protein n=1 Tax=Chloroflexus islandicus TaxID=1707952 RepID=UPI001FDEDA8D